MSVSIPPVGDPKATVTHKHGDILVTIHGALTPAEAHHLADELRVAAAAAIGWRHVQLKTIEEAGK